MGNTATLGHKHSEKSKAQISKSNKGKKKSKEHVAKMILIGRRKAISDKNWELLLEDFSKIDKIIRGVTYKELIIKYNVTSHFLRKHHRRYKK